MLLMGKLTISMANIFNSNTSLPEGIQNTDKDGNIAINHYPLVI